MFSHVRESELAAAGGEALAWLGDVPASALRRAACSFDVPSDEWPKIGPKPLTNMTTRGRRAGQPRVILLSCAGPQLDFPAQRIRGVAEVWVPFEAAIAVGWR
jgi:hypothetical protein